MLASQSPGAAGEACIPAVNQEGCMLGAPTRMRCDAATNTWQVIEGCPTGTVCKLTVVDPSTGRSTSACAAQQAADVVAVDSAGQDATGGQDAAGGQDAGGSDQVGGGDSGSADAGGIAPVPPPEVPQPDAPPVMPVDVPCPQGGLSQEAIAGGMTYRYTYKEAPDGIVLHGPIEWKNAMGKVVRAQCAADNKLVGKAEAFASNGVRTYLAWRDAQGELHGPITGWHDNGKIASEGMAKLGKYVGWNLGWTANGDKTWAVYFDGEGERHGKAETWHDNGKPATSGHYLHGKHQGPFFNWNADGIKTYEGAYNAGKQVGLHRYYNASGKLAAQTVFELGNGEVSGVYDDGAKSWKGAYKDGWRHGTWTWWYKSGEVNQEIGYNMGSGTMIVRHKDGKKAFEYGVVELERHGDYKKWSATGMLEEEGRYHHGQQVGTWRYYKGPDKLDYAICFYDGAAMIIEACPPGVEKRWK